jgi:hypothetical protein
MDEKLLRRVQIAGALMVGLAYFLPWASILSPFGSIQLRGLYVEYAWALLLLAILHLAAQFAEPNREALAIPVQSVPAIRLVQRVAPFALVAFLAWYGSQFAIEAHFRSGDNELNLLGTTVSSVVRAGLDYGYWIGVCGAALLVLSVGLSVKRPGQFAIASILIAGACLGLAFGLSYHGRQVHAHSSAERLDADRPSSASPESKAEPQSTPEPEFDASPYVEVSSIAAHRYGKDYEVNRYSNTIMITPVFKNIGEKTIVGLRGHLSVLDGFGKEVYGFTFRSDDKLAPGKDSAHSGGYKFEDNQFMSDEPYDKMAPLIAGGTAKYSAKISQIAFSDGTVLPEKK